MKYGEGIDYDDSDIGNLFAYGTLMPRTSFSSSLEMSGSKTKMNINHELIDREYWIGDDLEKKIAYTADNDRSLV